MRLSLARITGRPYLLLVALALVLALLTLRSGLFLDDYAHLAAIRGHNLIATPLDIFCFAPGDPAAMQQLIDTGPYPWFTTPTVKIHFFRPLSSALMALDFALFGKATAGYHLHCALWYAALAACVAWLMRRSLAGTLGVLALLVFVLDEAHAFPVAWWSNRNALVAGTLAMAGLLAHLKWREDGWKPGLPLSLLAYTLGLLGGETALGAMAYVAAYELVAAPGRAPKRWLHLAPAAALAIGYLVCYQAMGYGVRGMRLYLDPMGDPLGFLLAAPIRFVTLSGTQFFSTLSELPVVLPPAQWPMALIGLATLLLIAWLLRRAWPSLLDHERRSLRWLLLGAVLSTAPVLAAFTSGRLLLLPSIGGSAAIAVLLRHGWRAWRNTPSPGRPSHRWAWRALFVVFALLHIVVAAITWPAVAYGLGALGRGAERTLLQAARENPDLAGKQIVLVNAADPVIGFYPVAIWRWHDMPRPNTWWPLSMVPCAHRIRRTGPDRLLLTFEGSEMGTSVGESLVRDPREHLAEGTVVHTAGFDAHILTVGAHGPTAVEFMFRAPLDDPAYLFLAWRNGRLDRLELPPVGPPDAAGLLIPKDDGAPDWANR